MALLASRKSDEDLFAETTMTFGEHLEELRVCLWRAVLGLVIGFCLGLAVGKQAVNIIQHPLEKALQNYYDVLAIERIEADLKDQQSLLSAAGATYDVDVLREMLKKGMVFETRYFDVTELSRALGTTPKKSEREPDGTAVEPGSLSNLVPFLIWQTKKDDDRTKASTLSAQESFMIWIKASFVVGALISAPWVFYQIWIFVASGLYRHERKYIYTFLPFSLGLFFLGAATAYLFVFEPVLNFLFDFNKWLGMHPDPRMNEWISFVLLLPLGFGVSFQLPLVMLFLERIGVFTARDFIEKWRIAVLAIFVISAVLTPADPYSIFLMAVPLTFLYFGGILLAMYLPKGGRPAVGTA
jgi:sec-independent protein translocase protein TatC